MIANRQVIDGLEAVVQDPKALKEENAYLEATSKDSYEQMEEARKRVLELLHHHKQWTWDCSNGAGHCRQISVCDNTLDIAPPRPLR